MTKDTRQEWEISRDARDAARNDAANNLLPLQRTNLKKVMQTIMSCDSELHECYDLSVDNMKAIDRAEWELRLAFPELYSEIVNEITCTCEE